jgi:hypothetical protein
MGDARGIRKVETLGSTVPERLSREGVRGTRIVERGGDALSETMRVWGSMVLERLVRRDVAVSERLKGSLWYLKFCGGGVHGTRNFERRDSPQCQKR